MVKKLFILIFLVSTLAVAQLANQPTQGQATSSTNARGLLGFGLVTSGTPTYSDATINGLSLDLGGNLRTVATPSGTYTVQFSSTPAVSVGTVAITAADVLVVSAGTVTVSSTAIGSIQSKLDQTNTWLQDIDGYISTSPFPVSGTATLNGLLPAFAATPSVSAGTVPVTGTFWQSVQPVSAGTVAITASSPLEVSAGTVAITASSPLAVSTGTVAITSASPLTVSAGTVAVTGTFWQATQPVSAGTVAITSANTLSVSAGTLSVTFPSAQSVSSVGTVQVSGTVLPNGVFTVSAGTVGITAASTLAVSAGQVTVLQGTSPWVVSATANSYTPADGMTNVFTAPQQLAYNMVWNGTTWDRMHSGGTNGEATTTTAAADSRAFGFSYDGSSAWNRNRSGITSGSATVTGYQNVIPGAIYNSTPPTLTTGQYGALQSNAAGALLVSSTGTIPISAATALNVSAGTVAITAASTLGVSAGTVPITAASPLSVSAGTVSVTFPSAQQVSAGTVAITAASTLSVSAGQITVLQGTSPWTVSGSVSLNGTQPVSSVGTVVVSATGVTWDSPVPNATSTNALSSSLNSNISKVAVKASAGRLYQIFGHSYNTGCGWIHIFNSAAQPAANTAPMQAIPLCQNQSFSMDFALPYGMYLSSGIYAGFSTSETAWVNTTGSSATWINALYN